MSDICDFIHFSFWIKSIPMTVTTIHTMWLLNKIILWLFTFFTVSNQKERVDKWLNYALHLVLLCFDWSDRFIVAAGVKQDKTNHPQHLVWHRISWKLVNSLKWLNMCKKSFFDIVFILALLFPFPATLNPNTPGLSSLPQAPDSLISILPH